MAFLDNSGDIILDAVLTDTGRMRLAKGDGSFKITKFALGDDEINYSLFNRLDSRGSAYFDLDILQTPVFEAFSNNVSSLNSRLISISRNNLMYLPVMKINPLNRANAVVSNKNIVTNGYALTVDQKTSDLFLKTNSTLTYGGTAIGTSGIIDGFNIKGNYIRVDQGIDNSNVPFSKTIDADLKETQYLVEIDNRFARFVFGANSANPAYIDDDNIAAYYFSLGDGFVFDNPASNDNNLQVLAGSRGTSLNLNLVAQSDVLTSDYLFYQVGKDVTSNIGGVSPAVVNMKSIVTTIKVTGLTTGYSLDIPLVLFKYIS